MHKDLLVEVCGWISTEKFIDVRNFITKGKPIFHKLLRQIAVKNYFETK